MSRGAAWLPGEIAEALSEVRAWVRWQWLLRGTGRTICVASLGLAATFLTDFWLDLGSQARMGALVAVGAVTVVSLLVWVVIPFCRRIGWNELAAMSDKAHPEWEGSLTSAVELFNPSQADSFQGSPVMREMLLAQTTQRIEELDLERVVSSRRAWASVKQALVCCALMALPIFLSPGIYRQLWQRLLMPWGNWGTVGAWQIDVQDGDRIVARGADVEFLATATKSNRQEPPKSLLLEWRDATGTTDCRTMVFDEARQAFVAVVPHVMRDLDYRVRVESQQSRDFHVQVVEPPVVTKVQVDVEPPAYSGWPAQTLDGAVGTIRVFERSRLKFMLEFNKPVESASLAWRHGNESLPFSVTATQQAATGEMTADSKVTGPFAFAVRDIHKLTNTDTVPRELLIITDEPPKLTVKGEHNTEARPNDVVPIDVSVVDDIGVGELELHFQLANNGPWQQVPAEHARGQKSVEHRFTLDLAALKAEHGQWLTYKVRTTDERPDPAPHEVWSEARVLRINQKAPPPGTNELAKTHEELRQELASLRREIREEEIEAEKLRKSAEAAETNQKVEPPSAERFQQVEREIAELTQRTQQLAQQLAADPIFHELGESTKEVAQEQLPQAGREVQEAREHDGRERIDDLRQAEQQLAAAARQLQQLEKPFAQLADLQKDLLELNRLARQADQLANRADQLAQAEPMPKNNDATPENAATAPNDANAADDAAQRDAVQKQLAKEQAQLANSLTELLKRNPELLAAAKRDELERLAELSEQARELAEQQKQLAESLRQQQAAVAERNAELAERQQDLQMRAETATEKALANLDDESVKPTNAEPLQNAVAALQQGDLAEAQKQQQLAANELDRLSAELQKAKADAQPDNDAPKPDGDKPQDNAKPNNANADPAAQQLAQLAEEQRQLAQEVARSLNEQRGQNPPAENSRGDQPSPNGEQPVAANEPRNSNEQPMPANAQPAAGENAPQNPENQPPNLGEQVREARAAQQELAEQAAQLEQQVRQDLGRDAIESREAQQAARNSDAANDQANAGELQRAAESGQQAAQAAEQLAESLRANTRANPQLAQQADELAEQQQQVAEQMRQLSQTPQAADVARQQRQQQLNAATEDLQQQVAQTQRRLNQQPLNMAEPANGAESGREQAARSQENMQAAREAADAGNAGQAADSADDAFRALQEAAESLRAAAEQTSPPESPVPRGVGEQVAQAAEQLRQQTAGQPSSAQSPSGESRQQNQNSQPSQSGQPGQSAPGQNGQRQSGPQGQPGANGQQGQNPQGEGQAAQGQSQQAATGQQGQSPGQSQGQGQSGQGQSQQAQSQNGQQGQPGTGSRGNAGQTPQTEQGRQLAAMAQQLREAAKTLSSAARQVQPARPGSTPNSGEPNANAPGNDVQLTQQGGAGGGGQGTGDTELGNPPADLTQQVKKLTGRDWGRLPSSLRTELTQAAKHQAHGDYSKLIKLYFQEIAKTQEPAR